MLHVGLEKYSSQLDLVRWQDIVAFLVYVTM